MRKFLTSPVSNAGAFLAAVLLIAALLFTGVGAGDLAPLAIGGSGVTNLESLTLSNDLVVDDDATITGDLTAEGLAFTPMTVVSGTVTQGATGGLLAHGLGQVPSAAACNFANPVVSAAHPISGSIIISATNATSVTLGIVNGSGVAAPANVTMRVNCFFSR